MNILERQLIVEDKLLTLVCRKRNKSNLRIFHKTPPKIKIELRLCECNNPSSLPQENSRNNSKEMKELPQYMARHREDLEKTFTDEQKEIFEKFHGCWSEYMSLAEASIFEYAFKLGMHIAIETLTDK